MFRAIAPGRAVAPCSSKAMAPTACPTEVSFSSTRLVLLDRGMMYAIAHVRGGGEYRPRTGTTAAGCRNKPNTFGDFIACAEYLEKNGYTSPRQTRHHRRQRRRPA
jgi:protease II